MYYDFMTFFIIKNIKREYSEISEHNMLYQCIFCSYVKGGVVMKKYVSSMIALLVFAMLFLAACSSKENSSNDLSDSGASDKTVIMGLKSSIVTLDPANYRDRVTEGVVRNIFDGLVTRDQNGEIVPQIAEKWENPSPTEWIFYLRKDVKFHDGTPLTADDVVFTFERIITPEAIAGATSPRQGLVGPLTAIEKIDDYTVKFIFENPYPIFLKMLPHQQIVPKAYIEKVGDEEFANKPIGAGPFKFVEAKLDERIVLERFDDYYGEPAKIKRLVFDVIPENSSRVAALQTGEVHRIHALTPALAEELKKNDNIIVKSANGTRVAMVEMNVQKPPFNDVRVRKAMNHAIDMDKIVNSIFGEYATRLAGSVLPGSFAENTDLKPYEYDPEKAKALLAEAGYPDGFSVTIDTTEEHKEVAEAIASELRKINIDAKTRIWDMGVLRELLLNGERQMSVGDWGNGSMDPFDLLTPKLKTKDRGNYSQYSNPRVDELLTLAESEVDEELRAKYYKEVQQIVYDEAPWVFGYTVKEIEASVANLKNWEVYPDGMFYMPYVELE